MPKADYFGGNGDAVQKAMSKTYGAKEGEKVFYATANKLKKANKGGPRKTASK